MMLTFCVVFEFFFFHGCSLTMVAGEMNETIQSALATCLNTNLLKSEQEKCLKYFIAAKDVVVLLPRGCLQKKQYLESFIELAQCIRHVQTLVIG